MSDIWKDILKAVLGFLGGVAVMLLTIGEYRGKVDAQGEIIKRHENKIAELESYNRSLVSEILKVKQTER